MVETKSLAIPDTRAIRSAGRGGKNHRVGPFPQSRYAPHRAASAAGSSRLSDTSSPTPLVSSGGTALPPSVIATRTSAPRSRKRRDQLRRFIRSDTAANAENNFLPAKAHHVSSSCWVTLKGGYFITISTYVVSLPALHFCEALRKNKISRSSALCHAASLKGGARMGYVGRIITA